MSSWAEGFRGTAGGTSQVPIEPISTWPESHQIAARRKIRGKCECECE